MIVVLLPHGSGHLLKDLRSQPGKKNGTARSPAETGKQVGNGVKGFAFAKNRFGQADARRARMIKKNAVIHTIVTTGKHLVRRVPRSGVQRVTKSYWSCPIPCSFM